ncbi:MAG TPA: hypothetical protein VFQ43_04240, partial [Nitrososphaera sp.]|nr:hypothetical protein [Nitrososphaera sp.]
ISDGSVVFQDGFLAVCKFIFHVLYPRWYERSNKVQFAVVENRVDPVKPRPFCGRHALSVAYTKIAVVFGFGVHIPPLEMEMRWGWEPPHQCCWDCTVTCQPYLPAT